MKIIFGFGQDSKILYSLAKSRGESVKVFTSIRQEPLDWRNLLDIQPEDFEYVDLLDYHDVFGALLKFRASISEIFNFAAISFTRYPYRQSWQLMKNNYLILDNLLSAVKNLDLDVIVVHPLSSEVYEGSETLINEMKPFVPQNFYSLSKINEYNLLVYYRKFGLKVLCPIFFNHESAFRGRQFFTYKVLTNVYKNDFPICLYSPNQIKDWGYAPEFMMALDDLVKLKVSDDYIFGTGRGFKIIDFVIEVLCLFGKKDYEIVEFEDSLQICAPDKEVLVQFSGVKDISIPKIADSNKLKVTLGRALEIKGELLVAHLVKDFSFLLK